MQTEATAVRELEILWRNRSNFTPRELLMLFEKVVAAWRERELIVSEGAEGAE